ncbi:DEAD/DEAH box helicase [Clostridium luticellarii]|uniref:ATP-dependent RNA helicase DbpA n=1 Tax=Clostridium luticellarii TaxID=1691940 RepID=A0A2T0BNW5_9CLOT|nr:DEAD/DEAH box helicase [Clostridium luticellarii]PRR85512.1 ATP-dependent RNA helicase DbpA [Clostridium luticellarii]
MEMGTGKTRTALELINLRLTKGKVNKILWLCPCSVKRNLREDIIKHTGEGQEDLITICGIETLSSSIRTNIRLLKMVKKYKAYLIVDESNLVKNFFAQRTKNIVRIAQYCKYKLILNGTPISKSEKDLFAQWYILDWRILGYQSFWSFAANHLEYDDRIPGKINRCLNTDYLVRKIAPYTYQVKKDECLDLPDKTYETIYYELDYEQNIEYERVKDLFLSDVDEFEPDTIYRLLSAMQLVISGRYITSCLQESINSIPMFEKPEDNPRVQILLDTISKLSGKVIIFCKYSREILDLLGILNNIYGEDSAVPIYGKLSNKARQNNIEKFKNTAKFLIANKQCAGYGLNLQFCHYIIYYSNDWDYATRSQSEDRVHRIGQDHKVHIMDICAYNKLDERILSCLWRKEDLVEEFKKEISKKNNVSVWMDGGVKNYKNRVIKNTKKKVSS